MPLSKYQKKKLQKKPKTQKNANEYLMIRDREKESEIRGELKQCVVKFLAQSFENNEAGKSMTQNISKILEEHNVVLTKETMEKMEKTIVTILEEYQNDDKEEAVSAKAQKCLKKCRNTTCAEPGLHRCSRCHSVSYCSEACSWAAWGEHKEECGEEEEKMKKKKLRKERNRISSNEVD